MKNGIRKFIAVLLLLWLPLSSGSALAAAVGMQVQHEACDEMMMQDMQQDEDGQQQNMQAHGKHGVSCNTCGLCHFSSGAFMTTSQAVSLTTHLPAQKYTVQTVSFSSISLPPLLPPPLARA